MLRELEAGLGGEELGFNERNKKISVSHLAYFL